MLLDRASALAEQISNFQSFKNTADEADHVARRVLQFENISKLIQGLRNTLTTLADAGVLVDFVPKDGLNLAGKARQLREEIKTNPAKLKDPPFDLKHGFNDRLDGIAVAGEKAAIAAWKTYVDERADFGADDVLNALAPIAQFKASGLKIRQIRREVAAFGADFPSNPKAAIARLDVLIAEHEMAWTKLEASDIPTSVVAFIRAAAGGEATLSAYTPEVQSWLEGRDLLGAFRIKLK
jgi:hypothetical protein